MCPPALLPPVTAVDAFLRPFQLQSSGVHQSWPWSGMTRLPFIFCTSHGFADGLSRQPKLVTIDALAQYDPWLYSTQLGYAHDAVASKLLCMARGPRQPAHVMAKHRVSYGVERGSHCVHVDIKAYVQACPVCHRQRRRPTASSPGFPSRDAQAVQTDYWLTGLPMAMQGADGVLSFVDNFSNGWWCGRAANRCQQKSSRISVGRMYLRGRGCQHEMWVIVTLACRPLTFLRCTAVRT
jgi:hypothetical protein